MAVLVPVLVVLLLLLGLLLCLVVAIFSNACVLHVPLVRLVDYVVPVLLVDYVVKCDDIYMELCI